jgi:hypothetical protein
MSVLVESLDELVVESERRRNARGGLGHVEVSVVQFFCVKCNGHVLGVVCGNNQVSKFFVCVDLRPVVVKSLNDF